MTPKILCKCNNCRSKDWAKNAWGYIRGTLEPEPGTANSAKIDSPLFKVLCVHFLFFKLRVCELPHLVNFSLYYECVWSHAYNCK